MRIHVVYAHPRQDSFAAAIHARALQALTAAGHVVDDLDLYADAFQPVLSADERLAYADTNADRAAVAPYIDRLRAADALVLCFPTWWYGMPAILKGWFDRVWLPGVAFHNPPDGGAIKPGLTNIGVLIVLTTTNSPWWFMRLYMRDPGRTQISRGFARLLAPGVRTIYLAHHDMLRSTPASRARFLDTLERRLGRL